MIICCAGGYSQLSKILNMFLRVGVLVVERRFCGLSQRVARAQQLMTEAAKRRQQSMQLIAKAAAAADHALLDLILVESAVALRGRGASSVSPSTGSPARTPPLPSLSTPIITH